MLDPVADAVQARRVDDRQRAQHDRVHQGKNGCGPTETEGERQDRGAGEHARQPELPQCVAKFAEESAHREP